MTSFPHNLFLDSQNHFGLTPSEFLNRYHFAINKPIFINVQLSHVFLIKYKIKRIHHRCSVGTGKSQPEGQPFQWETRLCRVYHWNGGPEGWNFPVPLYTNDRFYFSISHICNKNIFILYIWRDTVVYLW